MDGDAIDLALGMALDMANLPTKRTEPAEDPTQQQIPCGPATNATVPTNTTPGPSGRLNAEELQRLARIRKDRANRFMVSAPDVDFLLEVLGRFGA